jgi:hypothetical protein
MVADMKLVVSYGKAVRNREWTEPASITCFALSMQFHAFLHVTQMMIGLCACSVSFPYGAHALSRKSIANAVDIPAIYGSANCACAGKAALPLQ